MPFSKGTSRRKSTISKTVKIKKGEKWQDATQPAKSSVTARSISQNLLKISSKPSFQQQEFYTVIRQLAIGVITDCGVGTPVQVLRNRHQPEENFPADSKKSVCWDGRAGNDLTDMTTARPCKGCLQPKWSVGNPKPQGWVLLPGKEPRMGLWRQSCCLAWPGQAGPRPAPGNAMPAAGSGHCPPPQPPELPAQAQQTAAARLLTRFLRFSALLSTHSPLQRTDFCISLFPSYFSGNCPRPSMAITWARTPLAFGSSHFRFFMYPIKVLNSFSEKPISLEGIQTWGVKSDHNDNASLPQKSSTEG